MDSNETKDAAVSAAKAAVEAYGPPTRVILRVIFILLTVVALLWIISKLTGIILLLVLSIFFAYLVSPMVEFIRRPRQFGERTIAIPKVTAIGLAYLILLGAIVFAISSPLSSAISIPLPVKGSINEAASPIVTSPSSGVGA